MIMKKKKKIPGKKKERKGQRTYQGNKWKKCISAVGTEHTTNTHSTRTHISKKKKMKSIYIHEKEKSVIRILKVNKIKK